MKFKDEKVVPRRRRWMCDTPSCEGEMISTGEGMTMMDTQWKHKCNKCGHEEWANTNYPKIVYNTPV